MNLKEIKQAYRDSLIDKAEYIRKMHGIHEYLFEYSSFLKDTDIEKIEISDDLVIMTSRESQIKMVCDKVDERIVPFEILNFGNYEANLLRIILQLLSDQASPTILDIGANMGWYSLNFAHHLKAAQIYAFEPISRTFGYLLKNIQLNQLHNIEAFNIGFFNEEKDLIFYYYPECSVITSAVNLTNRRDVEEIVCRVKRLDDFVVQKGLKVDLIKCDVEGAELFVIQGGLESIKRDRPIIFLEMLRKWSSRFGYHPNQIIEMLRDLGYRCFTVGDKELVDFFSMDENTIDTNFLFLHPATRLPNLA